MPDPAKQQKRTKRPNKRAWSRIPTEADWGAYQNDVDQKWAHDQYCGRSNGEMQHYFRNSPIEAASDLQFMPEVPFRYYVIGYRDFVVSGSIERLNASDAASCFLNLVAHKLERQPRYVVPVIPELLGALRQVAQNQAGFHADENIYGSFLERLQRIETLYAEVKDRYRRL